jgi:hypothetical protein
MGVVLESLKLVWWWSDLHVAVLCLFTLWWITSSSESNCLLLFEMGRGL